MSLHLVASLKAITYSLPDLVLTNQDLSDRFPEWTAEKIFEKTGIRERRIARPEQTASDLAVEAANLLFTNEQFNREDVDYLLFCTQTPDYLLPTSACLIHQQLGLRKNCAALDLNMGCSGYIYGLSMAKALVESGMAKCVLLLTGDTYSKLLHADDRSVRPLFGDAATASWITVEESELPLIGPVILGTDGAGADNLIVPSSACRAMGMAAPETFTDHAGLKRSARHLYMDGPEIMKFTLTCIPDLCTQILQKANLSWDQLDCIVFHQANRFLLEVLRKKLRIPVDRFLIEMEYVGNTVSSSIPLALAIGADKRKVAETMTIMLTGFGVGYSWGSCILRLNQQLTIMHK